MEILIPMLRAVGVAEREQRPGPWSAARHWQVTCGFTAVESFYVRRDKGQAALKS